MVKVSTADRLESDLQPWRSLYPESIVNLAALKPKTLGDLLNQAAETFSDSTAVVFGSAEWSFTDICEASHCFANGLLALGVTKGERIAIALPNCPEYLIAVFGIALAGATVVQMNVRYTKHEMSYILTDSGADVVITAREAIDRVDPDGNGRFLGHEVIVVDEETRRGRPSELDFFRMSRDRSKHREFPTIDVDDIALIQYTGGTTGYPKGVMLSHANITSNIEQRYAVTYGQMGLAPGSGIINVLPMSHVFGINIVSIKSFKYGFKQFIVPKFNADDVISLIHKQRPLVFAGVPSMYVALNKSPLLSRKTLQSLELLSSSGARVPEEVLAQFERRSGKKIIEGFGISEASPSTHTMPIEFAEKVPGSVGIPLPFTDARVIDGQADSRDPLPVGTIGELIIKGPQVMQGYWGNVEATEMAIRDGWLHTGDLARMDGDGYFYIEGRQKDMIVTSGFNVYPMEVEHVLQRFPGMVEAAVIGVEDNYAGEKLVAYIVLDDSAIFNEEELKAFCREFLAGYKVPKRFINLKDLPKTPVGKVAKRDLSLLAQGNSAE